MGTPIRPNLLGGISTAATGTRAALASSAARAAITDVSIDVAAAPSRAKIVRGGKELETPTLNPSRASVILENFIPVLRIDEPRAVTQSIAPGTLVTRGTTIDVSLLQPDRVTLGLFEGVHADLRAVSISAIAPLLADPEVSTLIAKPTADLTAAERQNLTAKLAAANVGVDDAQPDRSLGAAVSGLRSAQAFR
jgi:hypothetical protein